MRPAPRPGPRPGPRPAARLAAVVDPILAALMLLTRLPVRVARPMAPAAFARAYGWFPAVGALVGAVGGLVLWGAGGAVPPLAAALLAVAAQVLLTGGLHEDGLADVADGFGGGRDRERRLAIMRDSRIGTYGALALVLGVGLRVALLAPLAGTAEAVWTLAAVLSGIAGALYVPQVGIINPSEMSPAASIEMAIWAAVGGRATLIGPIVGAFFVNGAKSWFTVAFPEYWLYFLGLLFIAVTLFLPQGLAGLWKKLVRRRSGLHGEDA